jgi:hypothetical protein
MRKRNGDFMNEYDTKVVLGAQLSGEKRKVVAEGVVDCLIRRNPEGAGSLVGGPMSSDEQYSALTKALSSRYSRCVDAKAAGIPMDVVNGALAEALIKKSRATFDPRAKSVNVTEAEKFFASPSPTMASIGRCLAIYSPGMAKDVLDASAGTSVESTALNTLYAKTPECGVEQQPPGIPAAEQRAAIASGLYLWTHRSGG